MLQHEQRSRRVGKGAPLQLLALYTSSRAVPTGTFTTEHVGTAREILLARSIWSGAPLPTLRIPVLGPHPGYTNALF